MRHLTAIVCVLAFCGSACAADWPHLRGPRYDGSSDETGIVDSWPAEGPPVLWHIELGQGYSGFVVGGDRAYTQMQSLKGQFVVCLEAGTGREVWRHRTGWPWEPDGDWPGPMATPTVSGGRLYFVDAFGLAGCLDARDGRLLWSLNVTKTFKGRGTEYGYACSPLVEGGKVF
ncbi:PQQ-binding-like beta-propeller repeat protein, partial [bacterium]|nr:PQQ-binding-like beta-propeller repeat protein [bacterium]